MTQPGLKPGPLDPKFSSLASRPHGNVIFIGWKILKSNCTIILKTNTASNQMGTFQQGE